MKSVTARSTEKVCRVLLGTLALSTILAYLAPWSWFFDLFSHFRVQYAVLGLALTMVFAAIKRPILVMTSAVAFLANLPPIIAQFVSPAIAAPPPMSGTPLRVVSFNVFKYSHQYERMKQFVSAELPDVLILLEVTPEWAQSLDALSGQYVYRWIHPGDDASGIAVLSRRAPIESHVIDLGGNGVSSLLLTLPDPAGDITLLATHLSWPFGKRLANTRNAELATLARLARQRHGAFAIVGDLNVTPYSPRFQQLLKDGSLRNCAEGAGPRATWPAFFVPLFIQIDHCLASADAQASRFEVGRFLGSDHYPIMVDLRAQAHSP
jgi:endonuclease/exonuclease/phosphatase (EEP) superfamily protein YafD